MQFVGSSVDLRLLERLRADWEFIQDDLIAEVDKDSGVYEGRTFKIELFARYLLRNQIAWLRLPSGNLDLKDYTFRMMAKAHTKTFQKKLAWSFELLWSGEFPERDENGILYSVGLGLGGRQFFPRTLKLLYFLQEISWGPKFHKFSQICPGVANLPPQIYKQM